MKLAKHPIPEEVLVDHLGVLAKTGAGKTYMAKGIVEMLLGKKRRVCIVDPKDAWWGLKSSSDGKAPGFSIIVFGGPHADVPLLATHGKVLGEAVATTDMACIICTKGMPELERIRFLTEFFQTLDAKNTQPIYLVLDEAHMMAPQKPLGEMQRLTHWTSELVSGGRGMGFRIMLLSQRPARLNKDVLTQCESLVAMRMTGPQDRDAVRTWIIDQADPDKGREIVASLPGMPTGEGWFWAPTRGILERVKFPAITTYDSSKTQKDGKADARAKLAPVDLKALEEKLGKAKADIDAADPKKLREEVARLTRELAAAQAKPVVVAAPKVDANAIKEAAFLKGVQAGQKQQARAMETAARVIAKYTGAVTDAVTILSALGMDLAEKATQVPTEIPTLPPEPTARRETPMPVVPKPRAEAPPASVAGFNTQETKVLRALSELEHMRVTAPRIEQIAILAGYHPNTGKFRDAVRSLKVSGAINEEHRVLIENPCAVDAPLTDMEIRERMLGVMYEEPERRTFEALYVAPDAGFNVDELAEKAIYHPNTGKFRDAIRKMRNLNMIDERPGNRMRLKDWVFGR